MTISIQLSNIPYNDGTDARRMYLTEAAQQDAEIYINKISNNVVDVTRFSDPDEFHAAYQYTVTVAHKIAPRVAESIRHYFSLCLSNHEITLILHPWILRFVQAAYDRYKSILACTRLVPQGLFMTALAENYIGGDIQSSMSEMANNAVLNLFLYSDIIRYFSFNHKDVYHCDGKFDVPRFAGHAASRNKLQNIAALASELYGRFLHKKMHFAVGCYGVSSSNFYIALSSRIINAGSYVPLDSNQTISQWRKRHIERLPADNDFEGLLCHIIPKYIPAMLCESLPGIVAAAKGIKIPHMGVLATSVGAYADIPLVVTAKMAHRPLAVIEYGGGEMVCDSTKRNIEAATCDRLFGFGKANNFYLPSPFLAISEKSTEMLPPVLVANDSYRYLPCLIPVFGNGTWRPYAQQRVRFLKAVEPPLRPIIRLHVHDTFSVADKMKACFPDVVFQNYRDIHIEQVLSGSILLILDHYSTTLHRTMALNRPTILYSDAHIFTDKAMEIIEPMRSVGIWHDSPESAAAFYTNLIAGSSISWDNVKTAVDDWWFSSEVQKIREIFCDNYAMTSKNWAYHWEKAFDDLATEF